MEFKRSPLVAALEQGDTVVLNEVDGPNERDVLVVSEYMVLREVFGRDFSDVSWEDTSKAIHHWLGAHDAHYYARPAESFSLYEARREAAAAGKRVVVVDNLS